MRDWAYSPLPFSLIYYSNIKAKNPMFSIINAIKIILHEVLGLPLGYYVFEILFLFPRMSHKQ